MRNTAPFLPRCQLGLACLLLLLLPLPAPAWELQGSKTLIALTRDQQRITLGSVLFEPQAGAGFRFAVTLDPARFNDHFLSMKEFKCLEGPGELMCHVPYPYAQPGTVSATDLAWLEHSLLFMFKLPSEFGAKLWNGIYFKLVLTDAGLVGTPQAIDLNRISAPPDKPGPAPYRAALRDDITPGVRWIQAIRIE